jgi:dTDP-4-amino-4,6-dideoxygalactose transaminase
MALEAGFDLYLVDSAQDCPAMSPDSLKKVLDDNKGIRLVLLSHVGGWVAKHYFDIVSLCGDESLTLIEDCSSVMGVKAEPTPGIFSEASIWGFLANSAVPVGNGGVLCTSEPDVRNGVRLTRNAGKKVDNLTASYDGGLDLRISEWDAAIACVQLDSMPAIMEARKKDAEALQSIAPCLLDGPTNYGRYPVDPSHAPKRSAIPSMYALPDQLATALHTTRIAIPNLPNSTHWAQNHRCLPIGEGLYSGMEPKAIHNFLKSL